MLQLLKSKFGSKSKLALPVLALAGLFLAVLIVKLQPEMTHNPQARPSVPANFIEISSHTLKPEIIGFGTIKPDLNLKATAEVSGRITYIHPDLKKGEIFIKDTLLLKIDDKDYLLQLRQAEADVLANKASLKEMELNIQNNVLELKLAQEKLKVRKKEFSRLEKLRKSGSVSQSKLDAEQQNLLQQQQEVQQQKNKQTTLPSDLEVVKAQLAIAQSKLEKSQRDLARTEIKIPFNGRISEVNADADQYVGIGSALFAASGLNKVVVQAQFPIDQFRKFATNFPKEKIDIGGNENFANMTKMLANIGLTATIQEASGHLPARLAKVERFSDDLDPQSRTIGVTVSVDGNYRDIEPGTKPPLLEGMYIKVRLMGPQSDYSIVPRFAIHGDEIYLIDKDDRLERRTISDFQLSGNLALFSSEIEPGERLVTSDIFPVVNGMSISPSVDISVNQQIAGWLEGAQ